MRETIRKVSATMAAGVALVGTFAPWLRSGERRRSSFELFDLVERLGFAPDGVVAWVLRLWPVVPLAVVATVFAAWTGRVRAAGLIAVVVGSYVALVALGITRSPDAGLIRTTWGVQVSFVGGVLMMVSGGWMLATGSGVAGPDAALDVDAPK